MNIFHKITLQTLKKNRIRTFVTIIGIILSVAMFTAVTTSVSSLQNYLLQVVISNDGSWQGAVFGLDSNEISKLKSDSQVDHTVSIQNFGYAMAEGSQNEDKPYLFIGAVEKSLTDLLPVDVTKGRMPVSSNEILIPDHLKTNGGVSLSIGDALTLEIGERVAGEKVLGQYDSYDSEGEKLSVHETKTYTVVGFYSRPSFEIYSAPGYTALTIADGTGENSYDSYFTLHKMKDIFTFLEENYAGYSSRTNNDYLRYSGISDDSSYTSVLYNLAAILIAIIMFGSISLIYNSFSISVSERTKQFGLMKSIGSTKKQILRSVLFEALILCIIGIPVGVLCGIGGIGMTLLLSKGLFASMWITDKAIPIGMHVSWMAVLVASLVGLVTVLISAYIPAKKAVRVPAIESIRQTGDIAIRANKVKTSKLTFALFGFEGLIASKNFKRNRKKYRATVLSLFLSIVLFISASSFCDYLISSMNSLVGQEKFDIIYALTPDQAKKAPVDELMAELSALQDIDDSGYSYSNFYQMRVFENQLGPEYAEFYNTYYKEELNGSDQKGKANVGVQLCFVDDTVYRRFLEENNLDAEAYMDVENPKAVAYDYTKVYLAEEGRYYTFHMLNGMTGTGEVDYVKETIDGYMYAGTQEENGVLTAYVYENTDGDIMTVSPEDATDTITLQIATFTDSMPFCVQSDYNGGMTLLYPCSAMPQIIGSTVAEVPVNLYFIAESHKTAYTAIYQALQDKTLDTTRLYDYAESAESNRALIIIINIFSYGFIVLISLIAVANVFNTISTNINLRRREFAMLKSVGMTKRGFNKMMNFECLLYGIKGLIYGIPVAVGVTYLIYQAILNGWETGFYIPWYSIVISIGSVFAVVFATMIYSMSKIKKDNPIEALKNENL